MRNSTELLEHAIFRGTLCLERHIGEPMHKWRGHNVCVTRAHNCNGYWIYFDGKEYIYNAKTKELTLDPNPKMAD